MYKDAPTFLTFVLEVLGEDPALVFTLVDEEVLGLFEGGGALTGFLTGGFADVAGGAFLVVVAFARGLGTTTVARLGGAREVLEGGGGSSSSSFDR